MTMYYCLILGELIVENDNTLKSAETGSTDLVASGHGAERFGMVRRVAAGVTDVSTEAADCQVALDAVETEGFLGVVCT